MHERSGCQCARGVPRLSQPVNPFEAVVIGVSHNASSAGSVVPSLGRQCLVECQEMGELKKSRRRVGGSRLTGTNAFPDIDTFALWVPDSTLGAGGPVDVELPDAGSVTDETRHEGLERAGRQKSYWGEQA